ncbi:MAG TPA: UDP-N-acetylglucosamine 2-epimerase (non-hydrolyzing) [Candidatus Acidoferrales bacterium]
MAFTKSTRQSSKGKWLSIVGARPQFVKLGPVCRAIQQHNENAADELIEHCIVNTGQHYDREVSDLLFEQMDLPEPNYNLAVGSGSSVVQLARMLERLEPILAAENPDWFLAYGDTTSTLAGALSASRLGVPLVHIEAGCRSFDMGMPEEQARVITDHLSRVLLVPSRAALENLHREGIGTPDDPRGRRSAIVGDVMHDALLQNLHLAEPRSAETLHHYGLQPKKFYLLTIHRAENTGNVDLLRDLLETIGSLDLPVLFPVHPRTRLVMAAAAFAYPGKLIPVAPLGYLEMLALEKNARMILTDSGGVQKEAFYLGVPCVTLRERTEWPETLEAGANILVGVDADKIRDAVRSGLADARWNVAPYGHGDAAEKIVAEIMAATRSSNTPVELQSSPTEFQPVPQGAKSAGIS